MVSDRDDSDKRTFLLRCTRKISQRIDYPKILVITVLILLALPAVAIVTPLSGDSDKEGDSQTVRVMGVAPPEFFTEPPDPMQIVWNTTLNVTAWIIDPDNDIMTVTWDWGDGSPIEVSYTGDTTQYDGYWLLENDHVYNTYVPGRGNADGTEFDIRFFNITLDDGSGNNVSDMTRVDVSLPRNYAPVAPSMTVPIGNVDPSSTVVLNTSTHDREGDPLTWTYVFNDSVSNINTVVNHTLQSDPDQTVWSNITVVFGTEGNYTVTVYVSDALEPYQTGSHNTSQKYGPIRVVLNLKPGVQSVISVNPGEPIIDMAVGYVEVEFKLDASDPDGDVITLTWDFGDGSENETNTSTGGSTGMVTYIQVRNYTDGGSFNISVTVTDGRPGHDVVVYHLLNVSSTNRPPSVVRFNFTYAKLDYALTNETVNFTLVIFEPERDLVGLIIDFGDNSSRVYMNLTEFVDYNVTVVFNHTFRELGNYTVMIWYTDYKIGVFNHTKEANVTVKVKTPVVVVPIIWTWWDYTSLGLFCMIPVAIALQFVIMTRRRKAIESEGMSVEEWKLRRSQSLDAELEKELERQSRGGT